MVTVVAVENLVIYGCNNFIQKWEKTSNRKEVEPCLQYISSLKLPQREALRNIGPINAPIWSNLSVLNSVIKWPFYVELSVAIILKHWSLETTQQKALTNTTDKWVPLWGYRWWQCSSWKSCPFMGANNFIQKWEKTSNRKEVEPCLQYISSLKLSQREALRNIGPINAPIWSNLSVLNSVIKLPFYVELSVAIVSWSSGHLKLP